MLTKRNSLTAGSARFAQVLAESTGGTMDRRAFLRRSGMGAGGLAALATLPLGRVQKAEAAAPIAATGDVKRIKNICTHCSVGCTVTAEVQNGVWISQEPTFESPINLGGHCAKG